MRIFHGVSDLGAELSPCAICGKVSVLMLGWCFDCRQAEPEMFEEEVPEIFRYEAEEEI